MASPATLIVPATFVLLWSTGFVTARLVAPHAEPLTFLTIRFVLAAAILAGAALAAGAAWPATARGWRDAAIAGALLHGVYLGGVFWAVSQGLPAGISALIAGTQPIVTALLARPLLRERVSARQWAGIGCGMLGVTLVLAPRLGGSTGYPTAALAVSIASTLAITLGTVWQKRTGTSLDLRSGTAIQFAGAALVVLVAALATETGRIEPVPAFWLGLGWSVFGMSIGAIALLLLMIRRGAVVGVASLLFLVPPMTALMSYGLFGETLATIQLVGMALAAIGVALASRA
jgi:drug/metabolite transporter (DMT)-like permease